MFVPLPHPPGDAPADGGEALVQELREANEEKRLLRFQKLLASFELRIIAELGWVPLSKTGAEMLLEIFSRRYERGATMVTSPSNSLRVVSLSNHNLPFNEGTAVLGSERRTGALWDRLTPPVHIRERKGESSRLQESKRKRPAKPARRR